MHDALSSFHIYQLLFLISDYLFIPSTTNQFIHEWKMTQNYMNLQQYKNLYCHFQITRVYKISLKITQTR